MKSTDRERFAKAILALADYYGKPVSEGTIGLYWQGLEAYEIDTVERAIGLHLQNPDSGQWMPKIADLIRMIDGTTQDSAVMAWAKVMRAVGSVGMYQSIGFDDPVIHLVIDDLGGWIGICQAEEAELPFIAKRFETNYRAYKRRGHDIPAHQRYLIGICEKDNAAKGFKASPPCLVGDIVRAKAVLLGGTDAPRLPVYVGEAAQQHMLRIVQKNAA